MADDPIAKVLPVSQAKADVFRATDGQELQLIGIHEHGDSRFGIPETADHCLHRALDDLSFIQAVRDQAPDFFQESKLTQLTAYVVG
jgi:hypothetical protein